MIQRDEIVAQLAAQRALPLFTCSDAEAGMKVLGALDAAGLRIVEFTNRTPAALDVFAEMVSRAAVVHPGMILGAGTILDVAQAKAFHAAGAAFLVAPHLDDEVGKWCAGRDLAWCPGTGTVTEMIRADRLGAAVIKVFPADALGGPAFLKAVPPLAAHAVEWGFDRSRQSRRLVRCWCPLRRDRVAADRPQGSGGGAL